MFRGPASGVCRFGGLGCRVSGSRVHVEGSGLRIPSGLVLGIYGFGGSCIPVIASHAAYAVDPISCLGFRV